MIRDAVDDKTLADRSMETAEEKKEFNALKKSMVKKKRSLPLPRRSALTSVTQKQRKPVEIDEVEARRRIRVAMIADDGAYKKARERVLTIE